MGMIKKVTQMNHGENKNQTEINEASKNKC